MNITKRSFLRYAICTPVAAALAGKSLTAVANSYGAPQTAPQSVAAAPASAPFTLPPLGYDFAALEPHIDAQTMQLHHDRHHQAYVTNLNNAVAKYPNLATRTPEELVRNLESVPADVRETVRNNAGGHINHTMFWRIMKPKAGGAPTGEIARVINSTFGSFDKFKTAFNEAGTKRFGSGWVWLVRGGQGNRYSIISTPNQDNPMMQGMYPVMGNDVWEHAYYLKYQNKRADYLNAWWNVVNWDEINNRLRAVS